MNTQETGDNTRESSMWSKIHVKDFKLYTKTSKWTFKNVKYRSDVVR